MKISFVSKNQFGYHTDLYSLCTILKRNHDIHYICMDHGKEKIVLKDIHVHYIPKKGNIINRNVRFYFKLAQIINKENFDIHLIKYFRGLSIIKILCPGKKIIFDIRTSEIHKRKNIRVLFNFLMKAESIFFKHISIISKSLSQKLRYPHHKIFILPLGAKEISKTNKFFTEMRLLYVGTLTNRNIDQTLEGFFKFFTEYKNKIFLQFTIIGSGYYGEEEKLKTMIQNKNLEGIVNIKGFVPYNKLKPFFESHNIGISYIPITDYFDCQPPTKTFEYLRSGMPVIATGTFENKAVVNRSNGIMIKDTSESFYKGLVAFYNKKGSFCSASIRLSSKEYSWKNIAQRLEKYFHTIK